MIIAWGALVILVFSFYEIFVARSAQAIARSLVLGSLALTGAIFALSENELVFGAAILLNVILVLAGMILMRNEVQVKNDES